MTHTGSPTSVFHPRVALAGAVGRVTGVAGHPKAVRAGLNLRVKQLGALHRRGEVERAWSCSVDDFIAYQRQRFHVVYAAARHAVPFYRSQPGVYPPHLPDASLDAVLGALPVLPKPTVKARMPEFYRDPLPRLTSFHTTSGTTGSPMRIPATIWERSYANANLEEWYRRVSGTSRPRVLFLSGFMTPSADDSQLAWHDRLSGNAYLSIYGLHPRNRVEILDLLADLRPQLIYGYASALHEFAGLFNEMEWPGREQRFAVSTSEILPDHWRTTIEATVCRKVYDLYGSQELQHMVVECDRGSHHINPLVGIVEILDDDGRPTTAGDVGRVVVTGLAHDSFPLIRYEIGDRAVSTGYATDCPCGLRWPTIGAVEGRSEDLVVARDGRRIGYLCFHATKNLTAIREAQLVQTALDRIVFSIVPSETEPFDRESVEISVAAEIRRRMQQPVDVVFRYPQAIERGPNGKFKAVRVEIDQACQLPLNAQVR